MASVISMLLLAVSLASAADVTGNWKYTAEGRDGASRDMTLTLKQEGTKLTGTAPGLGRGGQGAGPTDITNGKVEGDKVTFEVVRQFVGVKIVTNYEGTVAGDEIKLKLTTHTPAGEQVRNVVAKRVK